jgi:lysophospholipase
MPDDHSAGTPPPVAAPLLSIAEAPAPAGGFAEWFTGAGGARLRAACFPAAKPIGSVVLSTGRTEYIEKYFEVIAELVGRGFTVVAHDWRGQGLSQRLLPDRLRGHAVGFDDFVADYSLLLDHFQARLPKPWIALSHSMGGCLTTMALARGEARFSACMLSAPMLGLMMERIWPARVLVRAMAGGHAGAYALGGPSDPFAAAVGKDRLTHDQGRYDRFRAQILADRDLALGAVTWGWVESAFEALHWLHTSPQVASIALPMTMLGAGQENLVDNAGQRLVAGKIAGCRYLELPQSYHEILMETDDVRAVFWREFDALTASISPTG